MLANTTDSLSTEDTDNSSTSNAEGSENSQKPSINEMRSLVGLSPVDDPVVTESETVIGSEALVDDGDFEEGGEDGPTRRKLWEKPTAKIASVALPFGIVCAIIGFILISLTSMKLSGATENAEVVESVEPADDSAEQDQQEEIARLKTSNALGNQASVLENQPTRRTEIRPVTEQTSARVSEPAEVQKSRPPVQQSVVRSEPVIRSRPVTVSSPPAVPRSVVSRPVAVSSPPVAPRSVVSRPSQAVAAPVISASGSQSIEQSQRPIDPFSEWQKLAAIGSYGQVSSTSVVADVAEPAMTSMPIGNEPIPVLVSNTSSRSYAVSSSIAENSPPRPMPKGMSEGKGQAQNVKYGARSPIQPEAIARDELIGETLVADNSYEAGVDFIMGNSSQSVEPQRETVVLPGVRASGQIIMPIAWTEDMQSASGAIELTEDLVSGGGTIMPAGTQLIVALDQISESGMAGLSVTSIILPYAGYEDMQIPAEAISIQGSDGKVLMAKDISGSDQELRRLDAGQAFLGALGTVGRILNRPSNSSNSVGLTGSISSTDYGSPSILGAVLEGGATTMINQRTARNQQRAEALRQRPSVWVLEEGTGIEIFINQAVAIGG